MGKGNVVSWSGFWPLLLVIPVIGRATGQTNLLSNADFESDLDNKWDCGGCKESRVAGEGRNGSYALKASGRSGKSKGPSTMNFNFYGKRHYAFEGYVKLPKDKNGTIWQPFEVVIDMKVNSTDIKAYFIARRNFCNASLGWIFLNGSLESPFSDDVKNARLRIRGPDAELDFLVDDIKLYELQKDYEWRGKADKNIEDVRKNDLSISVKLPSGVPPTDIEVNITQKNHLFAFGSMFRTEGLLMNPLPEYVKVGLYMFDWGTIREYNWKSNQGKPEDKVKDWSLATRATDVLLKHEKKVRAHSLIRNTDRLIPQWVRDLNNSQIRAAMDDQLRYMINITKNKLQGFVVMNEILAHHYFEERLQDKHVTKNLFAKAKEYGADFDRFLNEFQCISIGGHTEQYYDIVNEFKAAGVIDGMGIQSHVKDWIKPDPTAMWRRIDRLAMANLKMFVTEFDLGWKDDFVRADWFEDTIRSFFGHPALDGVVIWGFWAGDMAEPDHELIEGDGPTILEPGSRWICLVKKEWRTNKVFKMSQSDETFKLRAFKGDYYVTIKRQGFPVQVETKSVGDENGGAKWTITVTNKTEQVDVPREHDYLPKCVSHREQRSLGTSKTTDTSSALSCTRRKSGTSGSGENDAVSISCQSDEVLTGCFSIHKRKKWTRNGEKIVFDKAAGVYKCTAYNGKNSADGVKASAFCCKKAGLTCDYRTAGPAYPFSGAMSESTCPTGTNSLGCSAYSAYPDMEGAYASDTNLKACTAQSGDPAFTDAKEKPGMLSFAACCKATTALNCTVVQGKASGLTKGSKSVIGCPSGYQATGCGVKAASGKAGGVFYSNKKCRAFLGENLSSGSTGVIAEAICCY